MSNLKVDSRKEVHLKSVFNQIDFIEEENTKQKTSNLVLMALQDDKKDIDAWDAFAKVGWTKSF